MFHDGRWCGGKIFRSLDQRVTFEKIIIYGLIIITPDEEILLDYENFRYELCEGDKEVVVDIPMCDKLELGDYTVLSHNIIIGEGDILKQAYSFKLFPSIEWLNCYPCPYLRDYDYCPIFKKLISNNIFSKFPSLLCKRFNDKNYFDYLFQKYRDQNYYKDEKFHLSKKCIFPELDVATLRLIEDDLEIVRSIDSKIGMLIL